MKSFGINWQANINHSQVTLEKKIRWLKTGYIHSFLFKITTTSCKILTFKNEAVYSKLLSALFLSEKKKQAITTVKRARNNFRLLASPSN